MANIFVKHSLSDRVSIKFNITLTRFVLKASDGDQKWLLEIGTTHPDADGNSILPKYIYLTTLSTLDAEIEKAVAEMCELIDWGTLAEDEFPPYVSSHTPSKAVVSIHTPVSVVLKESLPSSGMDLSDIKITINNGTTLFDITDEVVISGDPYEYKLDWHPPKKVFSRYGD